MIDTLATFADQVTTVAREVGIEGKLGGQARVPGAAGIWRDLTDNVNQLAANLTTQVRAIAEVATAVTKGVLTRSVTVEAQGEVAALKDNINEMIGNLAETTRKNTDQDWLKTNIAKFTRMVQGQRDLLTVAQLLLSELAPLVSAQRGSFYIAESSGDQPVLNFMAGYAYDDRDNIPTQFKVGQGLVGQCAKEKQRVLVRNVPQEHQNQFQPGIGNPADRCRPSRTVRARGEGRCGIGLIPATLRRPSRVSRPADGEHGHRVEYDRGDDAYGAIITAKPGTGRGASEHQRGVAGESPAAGGTEHGSGSQESRD